MSFYLIIIRLAFTPNPSYAVRSSDAVALYLVFATLGVHRRVVNLVILSRNRIVRIGLGEDNLVW